MALPIYRYPLDPTGENPDNHVRLEPHSLTPMARPTDVRVAAPIYGAFFAESVEIYDRANGFKLVRGSDYRVTDLLQDPTLKFGKEISQFVVILNGNVSNEIAITYQVLGGNYQNDATAVQHVFETFLNDTRPVDWTDISGKPGSFPPSLHIHLLEDIVGWGPVIVALDNIRNAILLNNTPMYEALIDWVNSRKLKWSDIVGVPTTGQELGLTDVVYRTRRINTPIGSGLKGGGSLAADVTLSLTETGVVNGTYGSPSLAVQFTVDLQGRLSYARHVPITIDWSMIQNRPTTAAELGLTDVVSPNRAINTPVWGGLVGGGDLSADRNLVLSDTGISPATYGSNTQTVMPTIDRHGRITRIQVVTSLIDWSNILSKPTSLAGFGITDAVRLDRRVDTTNGLNGGGPLSADLKIGLSPTGVVAGTYGQQGWVPSITVDSNGRLTAASHFQLNLSWAAITNKPTTIQGFGITNAVINDASQTVTGYKFFNAAGFGWGSTAANIDNGVQSRIVTEDYMYRYVAANSGPPIGFNYWTSVTTSRVSGVTYVNTTGKAVMAAVTSRQNPGGAIYMNVYVNGLMIAQIIQADRDSNMFASFIIPVGASYRVDSSSGFLLWVETS